MHDLGVELDPVDPRSASSTAATGETLEDASAVNPGGGSITVSRWLIQHVCSFGIPFSSTPGSVTRQIRAAELPHLGLLHPPAELVHEQLHPVTDAHHRHPQLQQPALQPRRALGIHRRGTARQDDPARFALLDLLQRRVLGSSSENTPQSRTLLAISWLYWPP